MWIQALIVICWNDYCIAILWPSFLLLWMSMKYINLKVSYMARIFSCYTFIPTVSFQKWEEKEVIISISYYDNSVQENMHIFCRQLPCYMKNHINDVYKCILFCCCRKRLYKTRGIRLQSQHIQHWTEALTPMTWHSNKRTASAYNV